MKKIIIIGIGVVVLAIVAYYGYKWYQKRKASALGATSSTAGNAITPSEGIPVSRPAVINNNVAAGSGRG